MRALLTADRNQHFARAAHDRGAARGHARGRLPALHHRRRRHRPRRRRPRAQPDPPLRRGRRARLPHRGPEARASRSAGTRAARCWSPRTSRSSASTRRASSSTSWACRASSSRAPTPSRPRFLDGRGDERDQPFILGATNVDLPSYKVGLPGHPAEARASGRRGAARPPAVRDLRRASTPRPTPGSTRAGVMRRDRGGARPLPASGQRGRRRAARQGRRHASPDVWQAEAGLKTYGEAVADVIDVPRAARASAST